MAKEKTAREVYYEPTAYDSTAIPPMPLRPPRHSWSFAQRQLRYELLPWGVNCGRFEGLSSRAKVRALKKGKYEQQASLTHEEYRFADPRNPLYWADFVGVMCVIAVFVGIVTSIVVIIFGDMRLSDYLGMYGAIDAGFILVPAALAAFLFSLGTIFRDRYTYTILNRRTGMLVMPQGKSKPPREIPFIELDGYMTYQAGGRMGPMHGLLLMHRYSAIWREVIDAQPRRWWVAYHWEFCQQFMDTAKPLPDVPELEPFRHLDPTTADHDRLSGRPADYWRSMASEEVKRLEHQALKVAERFSFDLMRDRMEPHLSKTSATIPEPAKAGKPSAPESPREQLMRLHAERKAGRAQAAETKAAKP